jgi:hypothetical protein
VSLSEGCAEERREMVLFIGLDELFIRVKGRLGGRVAM